MNKILVVEDEIPIAQMVKMCLSKNGYICETANDGMTASEKIENNRYDLILLDIMLPDMDGYELIEYIDNDMPLLIWATMYMEESFESSSWYLVDGSEFTWIAQEHCMVLVGYDEENYYLNDPLTGTTVSYEKELVQQRFEELGSQAVCISPVEG